LEKQTENDIIYIIKELHNETLIITALGEIRNSNPKKYQDLIELHYKIKK